MVTNASTSRRHFQGWETLVPDINGTRAKRYQTPRTLNGVQRLQILTIRDVFQTNMNGTLGFIWGVA